MILTRQIKKNTSSSVAWTPRSDFAKQNNLTAKRLGETTGS